jgi:hypothetical protein
VPQERFAMPTDNWNDGTASWSTSGDWSDGVPTSASDVDVSQGDPQVSSAINIASLDDSAQVAFIIAGASNVTGTVLNSGGLDVDATSYNGGSSLTIEGTLTNSGTLDIGNDYLEHATSVTVAALTTTSARRSGPSTSPATSTRPIHPRFPRPWMSPARRASARRAI